MKSNFSIYFYKYLDFLKKIFKNIKKLVTYLTNILIN